MANGAEKPPLYAWTDDEKKVPLIWENSYGKGKFVVDNFGLCEKATRGFFAASYSLLTDVMVYPVLNGSVFYLDDFPSPVPSGDGTYIKRDYGLSIKEFYTNIWWPDMLDMAEEHGVKYTGVIIDNYEDDVSGDVVEQEDVQRFQYFGNMLLHQGGELGYHGYNHKPLSLSNVDYANILPYKTWESYDAMKKATRPALGPAGRLRGSLRGLPVRCRVCLRMERGHPAGRRLFLQLLCRRHQGSRPAGSCLKFAL